MSRNWTIDIKEVRDKINQILASGDEKRALFMVAWLIFRTGLKMQEITGLEKGNVLLGNNIVSQIVLNRQLPYNRQRSVQLPLPKDVQVLLMAYIQNFRPGEGSFVTNNSPLFPKYSGNSGKKNLDRHLKKYKIGFNELRRAGVIDFYNRELRRVGGIHSYSRVQKNSAKDRAIKRTIQLFQTTDETVWDYIKGKHRPAGRRSEEEMGWGEKFINLYAQEQRLDQYEILVENKPRKLIADFDKLMQDFDVDPNAYNLRRIFLNYLYFWVKDQLDKFLDQENRKQLSQPARLPLSFFRDLLKWMNEESAKPRETVPSEPIRPERPSYPKPNFPEAEVERMIFDRIEEVKRGLSEERIEELKSRHKNREEHRARIKSRYR